MATSFSNHSKKFYFNIGLFIAMLIVSEEIFSSLCLSVFAVELVVWIFKNLPKDY